MPIRISIIMPVYNTEQYLNECLGAILNQTFRDWELIVVNDFSSDSSRSILDTFSSKDNRIRVFENERKGISPALLKGYAMSSGQFITRMDADDIMVPEKLERLYAACSSVKNAIAVGKVKYFADDKVLSQGYLNYAEWLNQMIDNQGHYQEIYKECVFPSPCWMMSRKTFDKIGGFKTFAYPEDYDLAFRVYEHDLKVVGLNEVVHLWRDHDSRASRTDPNYAVQGFLPLKLHYFFKLDLNKTKTLVLWGAGGAGKSVAKELIKREQDFVWVTDNPKKIGVDVYGKIIKSVQYLEELNDAQIITAIRSKGFRALESETLVKLGRSGNRVFYFY